MGIVKESFHSFSEKHFWISSWGWNHLFGFRPRRKLCEIGKGFYNLIKLIPRRIILPIIPYRRICMTHAISGKGSGTTLLIMSPAIQAGILVMNKKMWKPVPWMCSGTTEPSTGLILKWRVSNINTSPTIAVIQNTLSLKKFLDITGYFYTV